MQITTLLVSLLIIVSLCSGAKRKREETEDGRPAKHLKLSKDNTPTGANNAGRNTKEKKTTGMPKRPVRLFKGSKRRTLKRKSSKKQSSRNARSLGSTTSSKTVNNLFESSSEDKSREEQSSESVEGLGNTTSSSNVDSPSESSSDDGSLKGQSSESVEGLGSTTSSKQVIVLSESSSEDEISQEQLLKYKGLQRASTLSKRSTSQDDSDDLSFTHMIEAMKMPASPSDLFKIYSFCRPSPLAQDDPVVEKIRELVRFSKASPTMLKSIFTISFWMLNTRTGHITSSPMEYRPKISMAEVVRFFSSELLVDIASREEDQKDAIYTIYYAYYVIQLSLPDPKQELSAGLFMAYIQALLKAIDEEPNIKYLPEAPRPEELAFQLGFLGGYPLCLPSPLANDDPTVVAIKNAVKHSKVPRALLDVVFTMGLYKLGDFLRPQFMWYLRADNNIITKDTVQAHMKMESFGLPPGLEGYKIIKPAESTIVRCFNMISTMPFESKEQLSSGQLVAYLHVLYKAIREKKE